MRGMLYGISSVAAGGDLLFAETCLQLGIPLRVLLPLPVEEFRDDFDEATWERAARTLSKAISVEVTGTSQNREERYYECGIETVHQSQILVALWNGEPAKGMGGTERIVSFAKGLKRPVAWINNVTGDVQILNEEREKEVLSDPELEFLNGLPGPETPEERTELDTPAGLARAWFWKLDQIATRSAPQFRHIAMIPVASTAAAAVLSGWASSGNGAKAWLVAGTILGLIAFFLPKWLQMSERQALWVRTRTAAEVSRSLLAFWGTPEPYDAIVPEVIPELSGMLRSLNVLKMQDASKRSISLEEFKRRYTEQRLSQQISYFSTHAARSEAEGHTYRTTARVCTGLATLLNIWLLASKMRSTSADPALRQWVSFGVSVGFQVATLAGALLAINDCDRRKRRYLELHRTLTEWAVPFGMLRTWASVLRVAGKIERALLIEIVEWRSLVHNHKLEKK